MVAGPDRILWFTVMEDSEGRLYRFANGVLSSYTAADGLRQSQPYSSTFANFVACAFQSMRQLPRAQTSLGQGLCSRSSEQVPALKGWALGACGKLANVE